MKLIHRAIFATNFSKIVRNSNFYCIFIKIRVPQYDAWKFLMQNNIYFKSKVVFRLNSQTFAASFQNFFENYENFQNPTKLTFIIKISLLTKKFSHNS